MLAVYTFGVEVEPLGRLTDYHCVACNANCPFSAAARYFYFQLYFLGVAGGVHYFATCGGCGNSWRLPWRKARALRKEGMLVSPPIPMFRRFGLLMLVMAFVALISLAKLDAWITVGALLAAVSAFVLPGAIKEMRRRGVKAYAKETVSADRPISLFESVGGLAPERAPEIRGSKQCPTCGLNNTPDESQCERCGAVLTRRSEV